MRTFEILTLVTLFLALIVRFWPVEKRPIWTNYLPVAAMLFILIHLGIEGYRWQMVPDYTLAIWLFVLSLPQLFGKKIIPSIKMNFIKRAKIEKLLGFAMIAFAISMPALVPVFQMPEPTGQYAIGTTSFAWIDKSRPETFTSDPDDRRLVFVQVWYPAVPFENATPLPMWIDLEEIGPVMAKGFFLPEFFFDHFMMIKSNSYLNAPIAIEQNTFYPILVFSHGYAPGFFAQNMVQMEELASHGYIVFSIGHAYESALVWDTRGQAIPASETQINAFYTEAEEADKIHRDAYYASEVEKPAAIRAWLDAVPIAQQSIQVWTEDTQFVLSQIERMNLGQVDSPFSGYMDTTQIGVFGQSFGGAVAFQVCAVDPRCKVSMNMDGSLWVTLLDIPLQTPFLMMYGEHTRGMNDWALSLSTGRGHSLWVHGAQHNNFTDSSLVGPLLRFPLWNALGSINGQQMERIMNAYTLTFFDQTLKGIPSPLLQGDSPDYPEVELKTFTQLHNKYSFNSTKREKK